MLPTAAGHRVTRDVAEEVETTYLVKQIRGIECHEYMKPFRTIYNQQTATFVLGKRMSTLMLDRYNILFLLVFIHKKTL